MEAYVGEKALKLLDKLLLPGYSCGRIEEKGIRRVLWELGLVEARYKVIGEFRIGLKLLIKE